MVFRLVIVKGSVVPRVHLSPKITEIFSSFIVFRDGNREGISCPPACTSTQKSFEISHFSWFLGWWSWRDQLSPACTSTQKSFKIFHFSWFLGWWSWRDQLYPACSSTQKIMWNFFLFFFRMVIVKGSAVPRVFTQPKKSFGIFHFSWFLGWWSWRDQLSPACTSTQKLLKFFIFYCFSGWWSWRDQLSPACTTNQKSSEIFHFFMVFCDGDRERISCPPRVPQPKKRSEVFHFSWFSGWWSWRDQLSPACTSIRKSFGIFQFSWFLGWWSWRDQLHKRVYLNPKNHLKFFSSHGFRMVIVKGSAVTHVYLNTKII